MRVGMVWNVSAGNDGRMREERVNANLTSVVSGKFVRNVKAKRKMISNELDRAKAKVNDLSLGETSYERSEGG
ncbi:MAG: hypothetical protein ACTS4U_01460 [Candidatus Hodgkinia cicadicola]